MSHSVWVTARLSRASEAELRKVFVEVLCIPEAMIKRDMHVTIYHARRKLAGLKDSNERISIAVPGSELRFMTMFPGGENPRQDIDPSQHMIGLRIRRANGAVEPIETLRQRYCAYETDDVLGVRKPSGRKRSAFGARHFQPHVTVLQAGAITDANLSKFGVVLRERVRQIAFDRLIVRCRFRESSSSAGVGTDRRDAIRGTSENPTKPFQA